MRPDPRAIEAKRTEIAERYRRKRSPLNFTRLRINELQRLRAARYPQGIPETPDGLVMVRVLMHHFAIMGGYGEPRRRLERWIGELAPWMTLADARALITDALTRPRRWRADKLAWRLKLIDADRTTLKITTIGAIDIGRTERAQRRKRIAKERRAAKRRAEGAKPRAEYLATQAAKPRPWIALGLSRASWYRAGKPLP